MEIQHFSHKHPLILEGEKIDDDSTKIRCDGCGQSISGSAYRCTVGCYFHLHKLCAGLPAEFQAHPLHQEHPLILLPKAPYGSSRFGCDACDKGSEAFTYHCSVCNFDLDVSCAMRSQIVEHESHKHPLRTMLSPALVDCHGCGTKHRGFSYQCDACKFWIHEDCASLPATIKHDDHVHLLTLSYSLPGAYSFDQFVGFCCSCDKELYNDSWFYQCEGCNFVLDVNCSTKTRKKKTNIKIEEIYDTDLIHLPVPCESVDLIGVFIKQVNQRGNKRKTYFNQESVDLDAKLLNQISLGDNNNKREAELSNHFSHNHPLTLFNLQSDDDDSSKQKQKDDKICYVCVQPISSTSIYGCSVCDFFIHKWCAELPTTLQHPCHPHPLILIGNDNLKLCQGCQIYFNGIGFKCMECKYYYLDVICASLPIFILHEVHNHPLLLREHCIAEGCAACYEQSEMFSYECVTCSFALHYKCALLPRNIRHWYDEHPFTLNYAAIKDGPHEYFCEFCEGDVDPKRWFYHCIDCDKSACARCIYNATKEYPTIKWGKTYNFKGHPHPLVLVREMYNRYPHHSWNIYKGECHKCCCIIGAGIKFLKCLQCNNMFHEACVKTI